MRTSACKIALFGLGLGLKTILKKRVLNKRVIEQIVRPLNYWRSVEHPLVFNALDLKKNEKVLDIGSPKLLSLYVAKKVTCKVVATDLFDYFIDYCSLFSSVLNLNKNYSVRVADGRKLSFKKDYFDKIFSVSVLEHIPDNGDTKAIKELSRVLKKNGLLAITVPYGKKHEEQFKTDSSFYYSGSSKQEKKVFYQRVYDKKTLQERLIKPSGLKVEKILYAGEKQQKGRHFYERIPSWFGPLHILLAKLLIKKSKNEDDIPNVAMVFVLFSKK